MGLTDCKYLLKKGKLMNGYIAVDVVKAMIYKEHHTPEQKEALQMLVKHYEDTEILKKKKEHE